MCLAIPARVIRLEAPDQALVDLAGVRKLVSIALLDAVAPGDYVIVHVGYALARLDPAAATATLELMAQAGLVAGGGVSVGDLGAMR